MSTSIITTVLILIFLYFIKKTSKRKNRIDENGNSVHKLPLLYGIVGIIPLIISLIISIATIADIENIDLANIIPIIVLFTSLGIIMCLMTWMNKITLNSNEIIQRNMWGKTISIKLDEIKSIKFNRVSLYLNIRDGKEKIKCHEHLKGFQEIVKKLSDKTEMSEAEMGIV